MGFQWALSDASPCADPLNNLSSLSNPENCTDISAQDSDGFQHRSTGPSGQSSGHQSPSLRCLNRGPPKALAHGDGAHHSIR